MLTAQETRVRPAEVVPAGVDPRWCLVVGVAGLVAYVATVLLEPPALHPEMASSIWYQLLETAFWGAAFTAGVGLVHRLRIGLVAAAATASIQLFAVVMCPASGHHAYGAWWAAQMAIAIAFAGLCVVAVKANPAR